MGGSAFLVNQLAELVRVIQCKNLFMAHCVPVMHRVSTTGRTALLLQDSGAVVGSERGHSPEALSFFNAKTDA